MSSKTIFQIDLTKYNQNTSVEILIQDFLKSNNFSYNESQKCYIVGTPSEKDANITMVANIIANSQPYFRGYISNSHPCFEYVLSLNQLTIKAFVLDDFAGVKHNLLDHNIERKEYYQLIEEKLLDKIEMNGGRIATMTTEKISDKSSTKLIKKTFLFVLPVIIIFAIIVLVAYFSSR